MTGIEFEQISTIVVYDPETGRIVHTQHHSVPAGTAHPNRKALEAEALRSCAAQGGADTSRLALLHVENGNMSPGTAYKVDPKTRSLVTLPDR